MGYFKSYLAEKAKNVAGLFQTKLYKKLATGADFCPPSQQSRVLELPLAMSISGPPVSHVAITNTAHAKPKKNEDT